MPGAKCQECLKRAGPEILATVEMRGILAGYSDDFRVEVGLYGEMVA